MEDTNEQPPMEDEEPEDKKRPADESAEQPKKKPSALQQQIQKQLQEQLQQQLQAAAARGQSANITPEQIQAQASAMVQAAAQAQAVVNTTKQRNWQPMNAQQIAQLSQIQAAAIVQARKLPAAQVPTQIQIQAQALVHAHTQAQIQAGIYKGDEKEAATKPAATAAASSDAMAVEAPKTVLNPDFANPGFLDDGVPADSNSPEFQKQLADSLEEFWKSAYAGIQSLENQTEQDFKNHNDLPLARIKRIMKSDEDVRMISAEAPVLFAKACELFILDLSIRSWNYSVLHKRRTLQKEDVKEAVQKTDVFDFLVDILH